MSNVYRFVEMDLTEEYLKALLNRKVRYMDTSETGTGILKGYEWRIYGGIHKFYVIYLLNNRSKTVIYVYYPKQDILKLVD